MRPNWLPKPKKELDYKSKAIAVMYLDRAKSELENEVRSGESERFTADHDIKCLSKTINYLKGDDE